MTNWVYVVIAEMVLNWLVERLSSRLRDAEDGLEAKLTSSRQFSDLKRQLQKKNELVSDLRARLRRAGLDDDALTADDRVRR